MVGVRNIYACAAAAAAVFCACDVQAVDWPAAGGTYTVPADTTNEVYEADLAAVGALNKVVFANENSALRFNTTNLPFAYTDAKVTSKTPVAFQGPGTVIFAEKIDPMKNLKLRRTLGEGDENRFVKFDFVGGIKSNETYSPVGIAFDPDPFTNAIVRYHGKIPVTFTSHLGEHPGRRFFGRFEFADDIDIIVGPQIINGVVRQRGGIVRGDTGVHNLSKGELVGNYFWLGNLTSPAAYLLEGGQLLTKGLIRDNRIYVQAPYCHFRQSGGYFDTYVFIRTGGYNTADTIPSDFIFGGNSTSVMSFDQSTPLYLGPMNLIVMDNAMVNAGWMPASSETALTGYKRQLMLNGGRTVIVIRIASSMCGVFHSFNGGLLALNYSSGGNFMWGTSYTRAWTRVYERGGGICNNSSSNAIEVPSLREPEGNVVKSIPIPPDHELATRAWQLPPSVEIYDENETSPGSNAVAIADYDFDSGRVTNITIACGGEGYNAGTTKANLRYKAGEALLTVPLDCEVGPCISCQSGDFHFMKDEGSANFSSFNISGATTNTIRGNIVVNMDMLGIEDYIGGTAAGASGDWRRFGCSLLMYTQHAARFLYVTNIIVKSGLAYGYPGSINTTCPALEMMELYGGHVACGSKTSVTNLVIGGKMFFIAHDLANEAATIGVNNMIWVDSGAMKDRDTGAVIVPSVTYGTLSFDGDVKIAIKDWSKLPRGKRICALDLSGTSVAGTMPVIVESDEGVIEWGQGSAEEAKKLYARRHSDGFFMIFR